MPYPISILNDVLGPVMRGPSSSHTAGSHRIGQLAAALLGRPPVAARIAFDPGGSYARVYRQQGVDLAFAAGLMGWMPTDDRYPRAVEIARAHGLDLQVVVEALEHADHPNAVHVELAAGSGERLTLDARSVGGGAVEITSLDGWPVHLSGRAWDVIVELPAAARAAARAILERDDRLLGPIVDVTRGDRALVHAPRLDPLPPDAVARLERSAEAVVVREAPPVAFLTRGTPCFTSATELLARARDGQMSLGRVALATEADLLDLPEAAVAREIERRYEVMRRSVAEGLAQTPPRLHLLEPSARQIIEADASHRLAIGGLHTRAAARALAAMHVAAGMGVICAAPTGGSAGVLPGVMVTLADERGLDREAVLRALLAAGAVGAVLATRATFAAEIAGCQVEIGAAGAMAAAAVVEAAGGTAQAAVDAAAIALQNTMGSICDPVQGLVEIPCHTRNAVAASSAFVCADLAMGGYANPIPLDETIDAVLAVGRMLPPELRCTALGGLATTPTAVRLARRP